LRTLAALAVIVVAASAYAAVEDDLRDGDKYFEDQDWKRAANAYDRAISKAPSQVSAEAYGKRAAIFIILKDFKGGLDFIETKAKARYPNAPEVLEQEALILWQTGKRDDAVKVAEKVVAAAPSKFTNQQLIGEYYASRDPLKTATAYEAYLQYRPPELEGGDVMPRIRLGFAYLSNARSVLGDGDEARANALYKKAVDQFETLERKLGKKPNATVNAENGLCAAYTGLGEWDRAINVCERIIQDPRRIDAQGSVWYNLATAYLARQQPKKARSAANEFVRLRKNEGRGHILIGDTFFAEREFAAALDQYQQADKQLRPNQSREQVQLSIRLGKTYRRLPAPASGPNPNLALAIDKLTTALGSNPGSIELATELGGAYLDAKQDAKATALTDRLLSGSDFQKVPAQQRADVLVLAGKALFNQHKLKDARQRFEAAQQLRSNDVQIQKALVSTINEQAFEAIKEPKAAQALLDQALAVDPQSSTTLTNEAVLAIDRGDCDGAQRTLQKLKNVRSANQIATARLLARTYLCSARPDPKKAAEAYAAAEKEAKKANEQLALAEIYTEWAPLFWDADIQGAIDKLEIAVQVSASDPDVGPAAKRNLALALYRRGWQSMRQGKASEAAGDFERATRDPSVLKGSEPLAFDFSFAVAQLDAGNASEAAKLFKSLAARGNQSSYLRGAYARVGTQFFAAYASYRSSTGAARQAACTELGKFEGDIGSKAREISASCWEMVAYDNWRSGNQSATLKALATAEKTATAEQKRRIDLDRAALNLGRDKLGVLESLNGNPPEALVDLGIVYDMIDKPKDAYEAWTRAKAKGVNARDLQRWIDAKRRIYGY
jgi:Tfp pilus assembly protein PilF